MDMQSDTIQCHLERNISQTYSKSGKRRSFADMFDLQHRRDPHCGYAGVWATRSGAGMLLFPPQPSMKTSLRHELWRAVRDSRNGRHACLRDRVHGLDIWLVENGVRRNTPQYSVRTPQLGAVASELLVGTDLSSLR